MNSETGDSFSLNYCKAANQKQTSQVYEEKKETADLQSY